MCSRLRTYAIKKLPLYDVELSYESGYDIFTMIQWLNTPEGRGTVGNKDFLVVCLGTNDVRRYGVDVSLQRVSEFIRFIRRSFPGIRAIGWMALSPRWKPTRFVSAANISDYYRQFNEHLQVLSHQLDFDVVDARLGLVDMRVEDELHSSNTTGKWKNEGAIREWFSSRAVAHSSIYFQRCRLPLTPTAPTTPTTTTALQMNNNNNMYIQRQYQPRRNNYYQQQQQQNRIRAPEGSPVLLVNENSNREQTVQIVQKKARPDTPVDPEAKRPRLFSHDFKPLRTAPRSQRQQQQEIVIQQEEEVSPSLPTTSPGLPTPSVLSPRQSTPRTPIAPPRPLDSSPQVEPPPQVENRNEPQVVENIQVSEQVIPMEQEIVRNSPLVTSKDMEDFKIELFDFAIIPIECKFHFKTFHIRADIENITAHKEFLEKKAKQQEIQLEHLMKEFNEDSHKIVITLS
ncbi:unnamed protein product [Rotaria sp. Silwood2]|nr:unnamed protein product [Rotaria sp. Silwood2]